MDRLLVSRPSPINLPQGSTSGHSKKQLLTSHAECHISIHSTLQCKHSSPAWPTSLSRYCPYFNSTPDLFCLPYTGHPTSFFFSYDVFPSPTAPIPMNWPLSGGSTSYTSFSVLWLPLRIPRIVPNFSFILRIHLKDEGYASLSNFSSTLAHPHAASRRECACITAGPGPQLQCSPWIAPDCTCPWVPGLYSVAAPAASVEWDCWTGELYSGTGHLHPQNLAHFSPAAKARPSYIKHNQTCWGNNVLFRNMKQKSWPSFGVSEKSSLCTGDCSWLSGFLSAMSLSDSSLDFPEPKQSPLPAPSSRASLTLPYILAGSGRSSQSWE